ncbi:MAG: DUF971 domain-containing protein [Gemmatales bacterium]|nr:DUF971 domain-containing protein [Gemmatales bacterium]MDW8174372.1 DUF971 domain-containing protein [Gemmatales bacterium]MDW8223511.1 DUF971 domain-containing protein [Gemmatales bacterium]
MIGEYRPTALRRLGETGLLIEWSDGHRSEYAWRWLRDNCPCANCREQRLVSSGEPARSSGAGSGASGKISLAVVRAGDVAGSPYQAVSVTPVGRYAYKIVWADGHDTGIYSFELLRQLCQCSECRQLTAQAN